jgi:carboxyl-terminal processing protease
LALNEQWRDESTLSLNLETRRQRVTEWDLKMLALENNRRRDSGLPVYGDVQSWKDAEAIENAKTHIVEDGDSVFNIAKKYRVPVEQIVAANKAEDLDALKADDILKLGKPDRSNKPDPLLKEASHILVDQIRLQAESPNRRQLAATMSQDATP